MHTWSPLAVAAFVLALPALGSAGEPGSLDEADASGRAPLERVVAVEPPTVVLAGGTVLTAVGERFEPGHVVLRDGRIETVGAGAPPEVEGATVLDVSGHFITPGLIDPHSHIGLMASPAAGAHNDGNEATSPLTPEVWAEHGFWPQDPTLQRAVAGGVTTFQVVPGSANLVGGRGVTMHLVPARGGRAMRFPGAPETVKMACGENPKRVYGGKGSAPSTRMGSVAATRTAFLEAREWLDEWEDYEEELAAWEAVDARGRRPKKGEPTEAPEPPARDLAKETLAGILSGEVLPQVHCYRADDMVTMMQMADEMGFEIRAFHHSVEAYKIRDLLAEHEVAAVTWTDWWGFKMEAYDGIPQAIALLTQSGARVALHSDSSVEIQRLNQEAGKAWRYGLEAGISLTESDALRWITLHPAWVLGIDDEVGSLEVGKRADVVVWDAHPFSVYARARWVFIDGALRHDLERPEVWSDFALGQEVTP